MTKTERKPEQLSFWPERSLDQLTRKAAKLLDRDYRWLCPEGSRPRSMFIAHVFTGNSQRVWSGELDPRDSEARLIQLSQKLGPLYLFFRGCDDRAVPYGGGTQGQGSHYCA